MTRDDILEAAAQIFSEKGFHAASMQDIANQYYMENFAAIEHEQALNTVITKLTLGEEQPTQAYMNAAYETLQKIIDKPR